MAVSDAASSSAIEDSAEVVGLTPDELEAMGLTPEGEVIFGTGPGTATISFPAEVQAGETYPLRITLNRDIGYVRWRVRANPSLGGWPGGTYHMWGQEAEWGGISGIRIPIRAESGDYSLIIESLDNLDLIATPVQFRVE